MANTLPSFGQQLNQEDKTIADHDTQRTLEETEDLEDLIRGDDYQLCFTANNKYHEQIKKISQDIFCIGKIINTNKVSVFDGDQEVNFKTKGWDSFSLKSSL